MREFQRQCSIPQSRCHTADVGFTLIQQCTRCGPMTSAEGYPGRSWATRHSSPASTWSRLRTDQLGHAPFSFTVLGILHGLGLSFSIFATLSVPPTITDQFA